MKFSALPRAAKQSAQSLKTDCLVYFLSSEKKSPQFTSSIDKKLKQQISSAVAAEDLSSSLGSSILLFNDSKDMPRVLVVSTGSKKELSLENLLTCLNATAQQLRKLPIKQVHIDFANTQLSNAKNSSDLYRHAVRFLNQYNYTYAQSFGKKKKEKQLPFKDLKKITLLCDQESKSQVQKAIKQGYATGEGVKSARELGNLPANICTPSYLANQAKKLARSNPKLSVKVLNEKQMRDLGMHSLLSVSAGSVEEARLIVLEYKGGAKTQKPITLVGKGITFDSGGISLKPGGGMDEMKFDMCGAASVMGVFSALNEHDIKLNVTGIIAAAENMPNGNATKPGDVVTSMSGQTIEILNTDAEGRLVLCDALHYAQKFQKPKLIIDLATLTGACVVALGSHAAGLYSNREELADELYQAGIDAHDRVWKMPLWEDYNKQLKSNFADLANIGGREAGSVTAACFLQNFVDDKMPWAHIDIAGVAWKKGGAKGATGRPVSMLMEYLYQQ